MSYVVRVNLPPAEDPKRALWPWHAMFFPRKFTYLKDAKALASLAIKNGATFARIEFPNGAELDFRPTKS